MDLKKLSITNYRNVARAELDFSPRLNCFVGNNGSGKTNVLDAVYYLSFCRSSLSNFDSSVLRHGEDCLFLKGRYADDGGNPELITCAMKRGMRKRFKRNGKEYKRLSSHIGLLPLVLVAPGDIKLIEGGSEERRRLMDIVITQYDVEYTECLNRYNKALQQRNVMLRQEDEPVGDIMDFLEQQMAEQGSAIYTKRTDFVERMIPIFQHIYQVISHCNETVGISYISHCQRGPLLDVIRRDRKKDRILGYSLHGIHRDDLNIMLDGHPMKGEGSQGQNKTFVTALKLAQFEFLRHAGRRQTPILLLDDIFDKLDKERVEQIVHLVAGDTFGQIFITDTNRANLDRILSRSAHDYRIFDVRGGEVHVQT